MMVALPLVETRKKVVSTLVQFLVNYTNKMVNVYWSSVTKREDKDQCGKVTDDSCHK